MTPHPYVTDLEMLKQRAQMHAPDFERLAEALAFDDALDDDALDALVEAIAGPVAAAIDCTQCANCCRTLHVCLLPTDVEPLAAGLGLPVAAARARYVDEAAGRAVGEWAVIPAHPCPLLEGNLCRIYAHRPHACRVYPQFTPDFRYNMDDVIEGAATCPIIYNTLMTLLIARPPQADDADGDDEQAD